MYYNNNLIQENKIKRDTERKNFENDKLDYFPFTSGDVIEKHRAQLGAQLKHDLQSYMDF